MPLHVREIDLDRITPNRRFVFETESLEELCLSIQSNGQEEPIQVCFTGYEFRIIDGEKRWRACKKLGLTKIRAIIVEPSEKERE